MSYESFLFEVKDGIATVTLNDPERLNCLTFQTYSELEKLMAELAHQKEAKVVVLSGAGKGFCSGGSVHEIIGKLIEMKKEDLYRFTRMTCNVVKNMRELRKPIVAAVNGIAAGAGAMLALASDIRVVSDRAKFAFLFGKVGLSGADMGALYLLPRIVGQGKAAELLYLGDAIDAREAYRIGLANRVVEHEKLMEEARTVAKRLAEGPLEAMGVTKELLDREATMSLEEALEAEAQAQAECMQDPDFKEGYRAFVEKRKAVFSKG